MKCPICKGEMIEKTGKIPEDFVYKFFRCKSCREELMNMKQLGVLAERYQKIRSGYKKKLLGIVKEKHLSRREFEKKVA